MAYSMSDLKKGLKIELEGIPYRITEYQHVKPGKGAAFVRVKIKSFLDGRVLEKTFHAGDNAKSQICKKNQCNFFIMMGNFFNLWIMRLMSKLD